MEKRVIIYSLIFLSSQDVVNHIIRVILKILISNKLSGSLTTGNGL